MVDVRELETDIVIRGQYSSRSFRVTRIAETLDDMPEPVRRLTNGPAGLRRMLEDSAQRKEV